MKTKSIAVCSAILLITFCCVSSLAQEDLDQYGRWVNGITEPWTFDESIYAKDDAAAFQHRWKSIGTQSDSNEWAGDYVRGDLHKTYLRWSPAGGFAYAHVFTCSTDVLAINYGSVDASREALVLHPSLKVTTSRSPGSHGNHNVNMPPTKYVPVKWGERHYLVEDRRVASFYRYVAGIEADNVEDFFIKTDDYSKSPEGMPNLPPGYDRFVRKPIEARISTVGTRYLKRVRTMDGGSFYESISPVRINAGKAQGLRKGMQLYVVGSKYYEKVEVTGVAKYSSKGFITRFVDDHKQENHFNNDTRQWEHYPRIEFGWQLTSSSLLSKQF